MSKSNNEHSFQIGELVHYSPFFDGEGGWHMSGDLGIVINVRKHEDYEVYHIRWLDPALGSNDMCAEVLSKVKIDRKKQK